MMRSNQESPSGSGVFELVVGGRDGSRSTSQNCAGRRLGRAGRPEVPVVWLGVPRGGPVAASEMGTGLDPNVGLVAFDSGV